MRIASRRDQPETDFPDMAKITPTQAIGKSFSEVPGKVLKLELENRNGFLVYEVEAVGQNKASMADIKVDAGSGVVLAVQREPVNNRHLEHHQHQEHKSG